MYQHATVVNINHLIPILSPFLLLQSLHKCLLDSSSIYETCVAPWNGKHSAMCSTRIVSVPSRATSAAALHNKAAITSFRLINPRRACVARCMSVCRCVCLFVCLCEIWHYRHQAGTYMSDTNGFTPGNRAKKLCGDFPETAAFELEKLVVPLSKLPGPTLIWRSLPISPRPRGRNS